jgi:hypothetical protein
MEELQPILDIYLHVINPMSRESDHVLGALGSIEPDLGRTPLVRLSEKIANMSSSSGVELFNWLLEFGRATIDGSTQNGYLPGQLLSKYNEAKRGISESKALSALRSSADRWNEDALSVFGEPNQFVQFKMVDSGKVIDWFEFQSTKPKDGTYLQIVNRIDIVSAYFARLDLGRKISFFRLMGLETGPVETIVSKADALVMKKSAKTQDLVEKKIYGILDEKNFWWFYRIPIGSVLEY